MVTCIDLSGLFKEKRDKGIAVAAFLSQLKHPNFVYIFSYYIVDDKIIYLEMEAPHKLHTWKTFSKTKFSQEELFSIVRLIAKSLECLHSMNFALRDVHPSRIQCCGPDCGVKFNLVGFPYTFKKLLKGDNFSGHINYSAPELILENTTFTPKVDVWSLGCCFYYLISKRDLFEGKDPIEIKKAILSVSDSSPLNLNIPLIFKPIIEACLSSDANLRPSP